jgi:hypothetical protein
MNEQPNIAAQCMSEIDTVLKKYNCELAFQELRRNGELVASQILVIQKQAIIKPVNGQKVFPIK